MSGDRSTSSTSAAAPAGSPAPSPRPATGVTVIDPSPDALASLERRTAEAGLTGRIVGRQGDAGDLVELVGAGRVDVVLCHRVLEVVDSPARRWRRWRRCCGPAEC